MVPPGFLGATEAFDTMYASPDLEAAKEFLAASGYTESNPVQIELWYPPEHYGTQTAAWMQVIQKQLEATGAIKVNLQEPGVEHVRHGAAPAANPMQGACWAGSTTTRTHPTTWNRSFSTAVKAPI